MKQIIKQGFSTAANLLGPHRLGNFKNSPKLWVLMYHRILPANDIRFNLEEPGMIVEPDTFSMHLRELKKYFDVMDLTEWLDLRLNNKPIPARACAITFDDGWHDNYEYALPIIKQEQAPITLFAVVEKIGTDFQFWPNIVNMLLHSNAISLLHQCPLFSQIKSIIQQKDFSSRKEQSAHIIQALKRFSDAEIFDALDNLRWREYIFTEPPRALMNWEEIEIMEASGLVKIASHTCNHKRLNAQLPINELTHEIASSKYILLDKIPTATNIFCFPNGDYNSAALNLVTENYRAAVTTRRGVVDAYNTPVHELSRIGVHQQISHTPKLLGARLSGWI
ncbi:polysaccharide deacetylase family protein [Cellvibrio sp. NN19]|uniref:polysaccharide deacetylase family protein n=1 Tax=Cellvibrio chitinivorans TaxID=3102792 RepID=UPI002B400C33|nr:polysaccharide deacetylase family protein [Cellvibrio sp. NN19]